MPAARPPVDPFNPLIQALLESFEAEYFPDGTLSEQSNGMGRAFNDDFKRPYMAALMADVLSGRWQMGKTQQAVAESLGLPADHVWVGHALNTGWMTIENYMRFRCWPLRPDDWEPDVSPGSNLLADMYRHAFIAAAKCLAANVRNRPTLAPQRIDALNYELLCELFGRLDSWLHQLVSGDFEAARRLIIDVCSDPAKDIAPKWYGSKRLKEVRAEIDRLSADGEAAFMHLRQLTQDWMDIFVATDAILEHEREEP